MIRVGQRRGVRPRTVDRYRCQNFNKLTGGRARAVEAPGMPGLHFHYLRNTGNQFAAAVDHPGSPSDRARAIRQSECDGVLAPRGRAEVRDAEN